VQQKLDRLNTVLQENIAGARLVKAFVRADHEGQRFEAPTKTSPTAQYQGDADYVEHGPVLTMLRQRGHGDRDLGRRAEAIAGEMTDRADRGLHQLPADHHGPADDDDAAGSNLWANGIASAQRINEVLDTEPEVQDLPDARRCRNPRAAGGVRERQLPLQRRQRRHWCWKDSTWWPNPGRRWPSWARPGRANPRWST
jgi:ATP-binding cassette, subfamily B, multidrug efflux pump